MLSGLRSTNRLTLACVAVAINFDTPVETLRLIGRAPQTEAPKCRMVLVRHDVDSQQRGGLGRPAVAKTDK
jgi:hypothetical protein